jgi:hypothetical protein
MGFYMDLGTLGIVVMLAVLLTLLLKAGRLAIWFIKTVVCSGAGDRNTLAEASEKLTSRRHPRFRID